MREFNKISMSNGITLWNYKKIPFVPKLFVEGTKIQCPFDLDDETTENNNSILKKKMVNKFNDSLQSEPVNQLPKFEMPKPKLLKPDEFKIGSSIDFDVLMHKLDNTHTINLTNALAI